MKKCELCVLPARMYCESDEASLCWKCDEKVHCANFLVARHSRNLLCHVCQTLTPWKASGSKLSPTVFVCQRCVHQNSHVRRRQENIAGGGGGGEDTEGDDDNDDDVDRETGSSNDDYDDDDDDDDDLDHDDDQVVPSPSTLPPPPVSSSSEEESSSCRRCCSGGGGGGSRRNLDVKIAPAFSLKRKRENVDLLSQQEDECSSSCQANYEAHLDGDDVGDDDGGDDDDDDTTTTTPTSFNDDEEATSFGSSSVIRPPKTQKREDLTMQKSSNPNRDRRQAR